MYCWKKKSKWKIPNRIEACHACLKLTYAVLINSSANILNTKLERNEKSSDWSIVIFNWICCYRDLSFGQSGARVNSNAVGEYDDVVDWMD